MFGPKGIVDVRSPPAAAQRLAACLSLKHLPRPLLRERPAFEAGRTDRARVRRAQAAKSAAALVRSFQPAIQEFTQASSELRSSLSDELGLDELQRDFQDLRRTTSEVTNWRAPPPPRRPPPESVNGNGASETVPGFTQGERDALSGISQRVAESEEAPSGRADTAAETEEDPDIERKRAASAALAWGGHAPATGPDARKAASPLKRIDDMTIAELEAELARRQALANRIRDLEEA